MLCPAQIVVPGLAVMETDGVTFGATVMVNALDVAVVGDAQGELEVITTVITSPLANVPGVKLALLGPTFVPFFFH